MSTQERWLVEHKGPYVDSIGMVWECGDDYCNCTEAQIVDRYRNLKTNGLVLTGVWNGTFYTDGEQGAEAELAEERRRLRVQDPEREAAIRWQDGVDYMLHA